MPTGPQRQRNKRECLFAFAAIVLSASPSSCGWIAVSWRWIWSIRSINTDYCNPRGQKEGNGPLRVHTANASSWQICAGMANMCPSGVEKSALDLTPTTKIYLWFPLWFFAYFQPPAEQKRSHHIIYGKINKEIAWNAHLGVEVAVHRKVRLRNFVEIKLLKRENAAFTCVSSQLSHNTITKTISN